METTNLNTWTVEELEKGLDLIFQGLVSGAFGALNDEQHCSDSVNAEISAFTTELSKRK